MCVQYAELVKTSQFSLEFCYIWNAVIEGKYILLRLTVFTISESNSIVHMLHDSNVHVETHTESNLSICTQSSVIA